MGFKAISLFSGIGGMDLAAVVAGFDILAQVEIDDYCVSELERNHEGYYPHSVIFRDVHHFGHECIAGRPDLIFGGFPCQPFSIAGSRKGTDDRRNLFPEFARIIGEFRPRCVLLENVPAICNPIKDGTGRVIQPAYALTVIRELSEMGYVCRWGIVSARDAGAAHLRERWWLVGYAQCGRHNEQAGQSESYSDSIGNGAGNERGGRTEFHETVAGSQVLGDAKGGHDKRELRIVGQTQENTQKQNDGRESDRSDQTLVNAGSTGRQEQHPASIADQNGHTAGGFGASGRNTISQSSMVVTASRLSTGLSAYRRPALINELPNCGQFAYEPLRTIPQKGRSHAAQIKAVGNSVFVPTAYALFLAIREALDTQGIEA